MTTQTLTPARAVAALLDPARDWVFCDFDGTLIEIAATPDGISVPDDLGAQLNAVRARFGGRLAVVSGRPVAQIADFLPDYDGDIWGAHGASCRRDGRIEPHPLSGSASVDDLHSAISAIAEGRDALLETKPTGAVVHYRDKPHLETALREEVEELLEDKPDFELHASKMAWEVRPEDVSKGEVVALICRETEGRFRPVVFGDDRTDEEAMSVAQDNGGFGVWVGEGGSLASHRLEGPAEMRRVLAHLAEGVTP